jgi:hypothetical protein
LNHNSPRFARPAPARDILDTETMMQVKWMHVLAVAAAFAVSGFAAAQAQNSPAPAPNPPTRAEAGTPVIPLDISGGFYKTFSNSTTGNGTIQNPVDSYGGMAGIRFIPGPWKGLEVDYSLNRLDQTYTVNQNNCGYQCNNPPVTIPNYQHQVSVNYVASRRMGKFTPFAEGGFAFVINYSTGNAYAINTPIRPGFVATLGTDYGGPRFGLRFQFRDTFYKAPNLEFPYNTTGKFMQTAEPIIGVYFRPW